MFVVDRVKQLGVLKETFTVPADFSIEDYMKDSFGVIHGKKQEVVVQFDKEVAGYIAERIWHHSQRIKKNASLIKSVGSRRVGQIPKCMK